MMIGWGVVRIERDSVVASGSLQQNVSSTGDSQLHFSLDECGKRVKTQQQKWPEEVDSIDV